MKLYVSPEGNDEWSGALPEPTPSADDGPVRSLHRAQELARAALSQGRPVEIQLRDGEYCLERTLVLGPQDSGTTDEPVVWRNYPGETPIISGSRPIDGWEKLEGDLEGLSPEAQGHVWVADLPKTWRFCVLYDRKGLLPRAQTEPFDTTEGEEEASRTELHFPPGAMRRWENLEDVEIFLTPRNPWIVNYLPLADIDLERRIARTSLPGTYDLRTRGGWQIIDFLCCVENVPEGMREPGNWMVNTQEGRLYLWPRGQEPEEIRAPILAELVKFEGDFGSGEWTKNIQFKGLTFRHGDRMRFREGRLSLQHDWEQHDEPNALVRLRGAEHVTVENCSFVDSGSGGIRLDLHAEDNYVVRNEFARLGATAIALIGYGPGTRDENRHNDVGYNHIHHTSQLWWGCSAIFVTQSGENRIHDNLIHNLPYNGIVLSGPRTHLFDPEHEGGGTEGARTICWEELKGVPQEWPQLLGYLLARHNVVEHNEIHDVMETLGDGNGIYISGTGVGNVVRRNYVHDITGQGAQSAIRTDGWQWYTRIVENVIWRCHTGGLTIKQINEYDNNIVADCTRYGCLLVRRSPGSANYGSNVRRNIIYQSEANIEQPGRFAPFYQESGDEPFSKEISQPYAKIENIAFDDNLLWCAARPQVAQEQLEAIREIGKETRGIAADPLFMDPEDGDFRLRKGSPALKVGFQPFDTWGVRGDAGPSKD